MSPGRGRQLERRKTHHREGIVLQRFVRLEGLFDAGGGLGDEDGLHAGPELVFLGGEVVELFHHVVPHGVLVLHHLGLVQRFHELDLQRQNRLHVLDQRQVFFVRRDHSVDRGNVDLLLGVVLGDDGLAFGVERLADQVARLGVHGAHEHHEAPEQLRLLVQDEDLEARNARSCQRWRRAKMVNAAV